MTDAEDAATRTIKRFFFAVSIGDGPAVWEELSQRARAFVLNLAVQQGMDFDLGSRLRSGTATTAEVEEYQSNLTWGIQRDLEGLDLANLVYEASPEEAGPGGTEPSGGGQLRVRYAVPLGLTLPAGRRSDDGLGTPDTPAIPAGSVLLSMEVGAWRVDRLIPRPGE